MVNSLVTERESRRIGRMTGHSYVILFGGGNDLFQEVGDALPIVFMGYSAGVAHGHTLPIVFQLERIIGGAPSPRGLPVSAIRDHLRVICNDFYSDLRCFLNIADNGVNLTIPFGPLAQLVDVMGVHADSFKNNAVFIAVVLHPLQLIGIPTDLRALPDGGGKVLHSMAQVVLEVLFRSDVASRDTVVVAAH